MEKEPVELFCPATQKEWRKWLQKNHHSKESVWLVCYKKHAVKPSIPWSAIVDEALCFGWVDGKRKSIDADSFMQFLCKRKPNSTWSKVNKEKVQQLIAAELMTPAGLESIETAKRNGSWKILDEVEALIIPEDLEKAFKAYSGSKAFFLSLSKSVRKTLLQWLVLAKRAETRQKRITEIAEHAGEKLKPKPFR
ncbi:YdeI/OmpD-associated family protein [Cytophaga hutchinsonii]|uniref:Bacteriocin-protection protein, YdeI/OmpD-associated family n=1 Tax=Cytophaga hutchinsonii (strain ATCC 33406 / DSM 1761 / CIP 103989 / NBRC 15051 / NCIMB 9469 / D465) TaxID=269798 RepID=A0A6N4SRH6_CYTH3|nr:YdeI/OmpD-associated family protein [Cytophaga hutchinsonii]ABG58996.1 conserved hypothetical protein [Cytophaga hutchinsonii ATCC 33406]SFX39285.1 Uncharacterized conserved protein YdeI, YjbR/CyaY-like superfamily, DUF1801 family [Cytophaga hutchinsonii ATCC 33406]